MHERVKYELIMVKGCLLALEGSNTILGGLQISAKGKCSAFTMRVPNRVIYERVTSHVNESYLTPWNSVLTR